jgi:hypothetical protein
VANKDALKIMLSLTKQETIPYMKKLIHLFVGLLVFGLPALKAQMIELRPNISYVFRETVSTYNGKIVLNDGAAYGADLGYIIRNKMEVNFTFSMQPTTIDVKRYPNYVGDYGNPVTVSYYELGFNRLHRLSGNDKMIPYTGAKIGLGYLDFKDNPNLNVTRLAIGVNAGVKIMLSNRVGFNVFGTIQSPVSGLGLTATVGSGGVGTGVSTYSYVVQFGLGGGLVLRLKD